ncbi:baculoviral IAP repeat-containing protein 2 isoform X1, partial [Biomphalaria glabrata]
MGKILALMDILFHILLCFIFFQKEPEVIQKSLKKEVKTIHGSQYTFRGRPAIRRNARRLEKYQNFVQFFNSEYNSIIKTRIKKRNRNSLFLFDGVSVTYATRLRRKIGKPRRCQKKIRPCSIGGNQKKRHDRCRQNHNQQIGMKALTTRNLIKYDERSDNKLKLDSFISKNSVNDKQRSKVPSLMDDLFSTKNFQLKPAVVQCYFLPQVIHPRELKGIAWTHFRYEKFRLQTFNNYPISAAKSALLLAREGFVYVGTGSVDMVTCYTCCISKNRWLEQEVVSEVHKSMSPSCAMVTGRGSDNVPIVAGSANFEEILKALKSIKTKGNNTYTLDIEHDAAPIISQASTTNDIKSNYALNKGTPSTLQSDNVTQVSSTSFPEPNYNLQNNNIMPDREIQRERNSYVPYTTLNQGGIIHPPPSLTATPQAESSLVTDDIPPSNVQFDVQRSESKKDTNDDDRVSHNRNATSVSSSARDTTSHNSGLSSRSDSNSLQDASGESTAKVEQNSASKSNKDGKGPTYSELGIVTERPKRQEYAVKGERAKTFTNWPRSHHIHSDDLADAGFYYAGYGDCARCFFCGGGLRNWEDEDDVWVEHARWFPKCAFIRQLMGQNFVDTVQELNKTKDKISFTMVVEHLGASASAFQLDNRNMPLKRDPAVKAMLEFGFPEKTVLEIASQLKTQDIPISADLLLKKCKEREKETEYINKMHARNTGTSAPVQDD